jgi:hypothetical protein
MYTNQNLFILTSTMAKRQAKSQQGSKNKRSKKAATVPVVPVAISDVTASTVALPVAAHSIKDEIKSSLFYIFSAVAASAVPVVPKELEIGTVNRTSDMRKLAGLVEKLIIAAPAGKGF